jgi:hypothetical protein
MFSLFILNVGKKKRIPKNTKKSITNSVTKCTEKRAGKNVKRDKKFVYEDFVIESTENSDCDEEMSNGNDVVFKEGTEFSEELHFHQTFFLGQTCSEWQHFQSTSVLSRICSQS